MPALLAQISTDMLPDFVKWIIGASGAMFLLNQALTFYKEHIRETPAPANTYATRSDMDAELGRERGARKKIHEEIAEMKSQLTGLKTETDNQSEDIADIKTKMENVNNRIDAIPARTISLLRETKGLI